MEPGCYEVAPGVHRIPLQMPGDGLGAVNVYALETPDGLALVDGGWRVGTTFEEMERALLRIGHGTEQIHDIYVTHVHRDHYTFAVELRRRHGSRVHLGVAEADGLAAVGALGSNVPTDSLNELRRAGAPVLADTVEALTAAEPFYPADWEEPDHWLAAGPLPIGRHALDVVHTPGHTKGHMVFHDVDQGLLFSGDHVLPSITPSIGFELGEWDLPLGRYLDSLSRLLDRPDSQLLPAHGDPTPSVHRRVEELLAHHDQRFDAMRNALISLGQGTATAVAHVVTWTRRERPFTTLDPFNQMIATCETLAHLDTLVDRGRLTVRKRDGHDVFSVV
ncbi:MBL fold metallo-hydrolase [Rhodococcus sp. ACS1]|uniref:MBL fold metallo-hydrolase n=1 Tax=Rhodococcus TaxID=1827 RepID=UPI000BB113CD|nr:MULTISPECIES: MBL fold metallo-hydrolase [Rhodococcus]PBC46455.1 MBL fold metallo-hydrolase [Rhodococcus sp. ACS1]QSE85327.1 MBL fold metallo-hydrolase [Rhodococcus koreensis]